LPSRVKAFYCVLVLDVEFISNHMKQIRNPIT